MNRYVIDAYAWIEYLMGSERGRPIRDILEDESAEVYTCAVTIAEVVSKAAREGRDTGGAYGVLLSNSNTVSVDEELSKEAGLLHSEMRKTIIDFGLADSYILATARRLDAKVLTGDPHFKGMAEAVLI